MIMNNREQDCRCCFPNSISWMGWFVFCHCWKLGLRNSDDSLDCKMSSHSEFISIFPSCLCMLLWTPRGIKTLPSFDKISGCLDRFRNYPNTFIFSMQNRMVSLAFYSESQLPPRVDNKGHFGFKYVWWQVTWNSIRSIKSNDASLVVRLHKSMHSWMFLLIETRSQNLSMRIQFSCSWVEFVPYQNSF